MCIDVHLEIRSANQQSLDITIHVRDIVDFRQILHGIGLLEDTPDASINDEARINVKVASTSSSDRSL